MGGLTVRDTWKSLIDRREVPDAGGGATRESRCMLLHQVTVREVMHDGIVTCSPSADLEQVAAAMAEHGIHCLLAIDEGPPGEDDDRLWGVVSDLDLMRGVESPVTLDAGNLAELDVATVAPGDTLDVAARRLAASGEPVIAVVDHGELRGIIAGEDITTLVVATAPARSA
jgi:CBS domain-containing protein